MKTYSKRIWKIFKCSIKLFFISIFLNSSLPAIYTHHKIPDQKYVEAGQQFESVVKIHVLDDRGHVKAAGTGTWTIDPNTGKKFILTAAHVLRDGSSYRVRINGKNFKINRIEYFEDFILKKYIKDYAITVSDVRHHKRLFGIRLSEESDLNEALRSYGLDLAAAYLTEEPDLKPYCLASSPLNFENPNLYWAVGFGESGSGGSFGGIPGFMRFSGVRKAFNPDLQPHYHLNFIRIDNGKTQIFRLLGSIFHETAGPALTGQIGPGDSGGPVLRRSPKHGWEVCAIICSSISRIHTKPTQDDDSLWARIIKKIGVLADNRTPLSYLFWREGNVYGSEAHYIDVTSPLIKEWLKDGQKKENLNH